MSPRLAMTYFELLGIIPAFALDLAALEAAYFREQRRYHPDRFVRKPPAERQAATQRSVDINQAYQTLKNPLIRAQYLLQLQGIKVGTESDSVKPSQALLLENLELREQMSEARDAQALAALHTSLQRMLQASQTALAQLYAEAQWERMAQETLRLGYLIKAEHELEIHRKRIA